MRAAKSRDTPLTVRGRLYEQLVALRREVSKLLLAVMDVCAAATVARAAEPEVRSCDVRVQGRLIHCIEQGEGPPVILLHALGGDVTDWRSNMTALAQGGGA